MNDPVRVQKGKSFHDIACGSPDDALGQATVAPLERLVSACVANCFWNLSSITKLEQQVEVSLSAPLVKNTNYSWVLVLAKDAQLVLNIFKHLFIGFALNLLARPYVVIINFYFVHARLVTSADRVANIDMFEHHTRPVHA